MSKYRYNPKDVISGMGGAVFIAVAVVISPLLWRWYRRWGAGDAEVQRTLPGDDLVPNPRSASTRAITIQSPASRVWPWLQQIGLKRGGWYSYDFLEAMAGAADFIDGHSAERVIPELQEMKVADRIWMHARILPLTVVALEPERAIVFLTRVDMQTKAGFELGDKMPEQYVNSSWVFFLDSAGEKTTRLLVRSRLDYTPNIFNRIAWRVFTDPISFVMERKMLFNIKRLAEAANKAD